MLQQFLTKTQAKDLWRTLSIRMPEGLIPNTSCSSRTRIKSPMGLPTMAAVLTVHRSRRVLMLPSRRKTPLLWSNRSLSFHRFSSHKNPFWRPTLISISKGCTLVRTWIKPPQTTFDHRATPTSLASSEALMHKPINLMLLLASQKVPWCRDSNKPQTLPIKTRTYYSSRKVTTMPTPIKSIRNF